MGKVETEALGEACSYQELQKLTETHREAMLAYIKVRRLMGLVGSPRLKVVKDE